MNSTPRIEALPRTSAERAASAIDCLPHPAFAMIAAGHQIRMNEAWLGRIRHEDGNSSVDWSNAVHHEDRPASRAAMLAGILGGKPFTLNVRLHDDPLPRWHVLAARPTQGDMPDGLWYVIATDIHDNHSATNELRQSEANLRRIIEYQPACVKIVSPAGMLEEMNPAGLKMIGATDRSAVVGREVVGLIHQDDHDAFLSAHRLALDGKTSESAFRILGLDGVERKMESYSAPLTDVAGRVEAVVSVTRDVTERVRQSELRALGSSVLDAISAGKPLKSILETLALQVDRTNPATIASIRLVEDDRLQPGAAPGLPAAYNEQVHGTEVREGAGSCATAAARRTQVITSNISTDPQWDGLAQAAASFGLAACWSTPILGPDGNVLATFALYSRSPRPPMPHEEALIAEVCQYVRVAIERTRQTEHLRRSEAHYRTIHDMVPVLIWEEDWADVIPQIEALERRGVSDLSAYFDAHPEDLTSILKAVRVLSVNRTGARMFGAETGEELIAAFDDLVESPGARRIFVKSLAAWAAGEREMEAESVNFDLHGRVLHLLVKVALPLRGTDETRLVLSEMDITAMRLADERFRIIAHATSDVVLDRDLIQNRLWCSEGILSRFGHDPEALSSGAIAYSSLIHPEDRDRVLSGLAAAVASGNASWSSAYRFRRADGYYADVRERGTILRDDGGRGLRIIGSLVDITDQLRMEEQLRQSQRLDAIGRLTGGVAHDFNNLLTVILGNTEILGERVEDKSLRALAEMCTAAAVRGAELTGRLLAFARKQSLDPRRVDVDVLVRDLEGLLRRALGEQIDIRLIANHPVWSAMADAPQLESAILNLCLNARDAMPRGGQLTVETTNVEIGTDDTSGVPDLPPGDYVAITVSDNGDGMDASTLARAVEPFFTTKEVGKGSGLGLSMVYGFVKQSNGHVDISSVPGVGTTVRLYLPRSVEAPDTQEPVAKALESPGGSESILLVEDDDLVRMHVEAQLVALGYMVTSVADGHSALAALEGDTEFELMFTDIVMPGGMNGAELVEQVRTQYPDLPVLFTSGYSDEQIGRTALSDQQILRKPYRRQDLALRIRGLLDSAHRPKPMIAAHSPLGDRDQRAE